MITPERIDVGYAASAATAFCLDTDERVPAAVRATVALGEWIGLAIAGLLARRAPRPDPAHARGAAVRRAVSEDASAGSAPRQAPRDASGDARLRTEGAALVVGLYHDWPCLPIFSASPRHGG